MTQPDYTPPPPEPIEWDTDKAAMIATGVGGILHSLDPLADTPFGPDLWRMTEADAKAIGEPLSRILNRYATARELAGYSDEVGLGMAVWPYFKSNLQTRGRVRMMIKRQRQQSPHASGYQPETPATPAPASPAQTPAADPVAPVEQAHLAEPSVEVAPPHRGDDLGLFTPLETTPLVPIPDKRPGE